MAGPASMNLWLTDAVIWEQAKIYVRDQSFIC